MKNICYLNVSKKPKLALDDENISYFSISEKLRRFGNITIDNVFHHPVQALNMNYMPILLFIYPYSKTYEKARTNYTSKLFPV